MATADELLNAIDTDKTLIIDKDLRTITIPSSVKNLGVESDDDVLRLKFSMPRMYGDVDLSDFSIYINYTNAKNTGDVYIVDDKTIADDTITFSWLVGRVALAYKGSVRFIVCMKKYDNDSNVVQEYNTTIASLPVLEGLETREAIIQQNPDIIEMLLMSLGGLEPLIGTTQTITPSQVLAAIKAGRDIALQYNTNLIMGTVVFSAFNANETQGAVVSNLILPQFEGLTVTLMGNVANDEWTFTVTNTATKDDIGTAVNEALAAAKASGEFDGADGLTPTIGDNGNWYLGETDTGKPSRGERGETGAKGEKGDTGATGADGKSAYQYAQDGGYTGTEAEFAAKLAQEKFANPNALTFTGAVEGSYDGSKPLTVEIPSEGGNKGWTLLYDGTITIEEAVKTVTVSLLAPCEGMVDFIGHISWTANANTESGDDSISIGVGKANMGYGRIGKASKDGNSIFQATVTSSRTYWGVANSNLGLEFNKANMMYGFSKNINNANYETATIDFFAKTYAGTITLQLYGR